MYPHFGKANSQLLLDAFNFSSKHPPTLCAVSYTASENGGEHPPEFLVEIKDGLKGVWKAEHFQHYEKLGVKEFWEIYPELEGVLVHREYRDGHYQLTYGYERGDKISPLGYPDISIDLDELFA